MPLNFSSSSDSVFERWHPVREAMDDTYRIYRLFLEPITKLDKDNLLPKIKRDSKFHHDLRIQLSQWSPDSTTAINLLLNSVFNSDPARGFQNSGNLEEWVENVDLMHTDLGDFTRKALRLSLAYGSSYTLLNLPQRPLGFEASSLDQEQQFLMPVLRLFNPLELLNWKMDVGDVLSEVWFVTLEVVNNAWAYKWYHVTKTNYTEYMLPVKDAENGEKPVEFASAVHGFGFVPMVPSYYQLVEPMIGESYIKESALLDIKKFRQEADAEYDRTLVNHPQMFVKTDEDFGTVEVDAAKYLKLKPDDEAGYLNPASTTYEVNEAAIKQTRMDIARKLQLDPTGFSNEEAKVQVSGVSRQLNFALREADMLAQVADVAEKFESDVLDMSFKIVEDQEPVDVFSAYNKDFTLNSVDVQMTVYNSIGDKIPSPTYHAEMLKSFARAQLGNKPTVVEEAEKEIDASFAAMAAEPDPEPPAPPESNDEVEDEETDDELEE